MEHKRNKNLASEFLNFLEYLMIVCGMLKGMEKRVIYERYFLEMHDCYKELENYKSDIESIDDFCQLEIFNKASDDGKKFLIMVAEKAFNGDKYDEKFQL